MGDVNGDPPSEHSVVADFLPFRRKAITGPLTATSNRWARAAAPSHFRAAHTQSAFCVILLRTNKIENNRAKQQRVWHTHTQILGIDFLCLRVLILLPQIFSLLSYFPRSEHNNMQIGRRRAYKMCRQLFIFIFFSLLVSF